MNIWVSIKDWFFLIDVFFVDNTQYRQYLNLPSLMGEKFYKPPSIRRAKDWTPVPASIGIQLVDIGNTTNNTYSKLYHQMYTVK